MTHYARRVATFGTTIFAEINQLAAQYGAINLGQGKPDWEPPEEIIADFMETLHGGGFNQYAPANGLPALQQAIAAHQHRFYQHVVDPTRGVVVTAGATEAIFAAILGLTDPGDEVIVIEPFFDSYVPNILMAHAIPVYVPLHPPTWTLDLDELAAAITPRTRAILHNSPHNPTGHIFTAQEMQGIASLCQEHDLIAISDEVYEHLYFDDARHIPLTTVPGMAERTITIGSAGKIFSATGWKVGWACGAPEIMEGVARAHQFITFAANHPTQHAIATALMLPDSYFASYRQMYAAKRDLFMQLLGEAGFTYHIPSGSYFILAEYRAHFSGAPDDFSRWLVERAGVAAVPIPTFFSAEHAHLADGYIRFAFCKSDDLLRQAGARLAQLRA
ncbi:MAG: aminotransferase class I/II-fold pyridoxal phosphate-dependent enzyme [Ktedonobacterales bacterium]|nr:aminotransferase class I/II-fold pyridoxal phosphate-dependent enzyme [Ktedonobacterales bacterium]